MKYLSSTIIILCSIMSCTWHIYSTEVNNTKMKKCDTLYHQIKDSPSYLEILSKIKKRQYTSINHIMNNNMMIDYSYIIDNLPEHLISFSREINGNKYKIPTLIGHETIYHNNEQYKMFFWGVKPFENDNTVYIFLKNTDNNDKENTDENNKENIREYR